MKAKAQTEEGACCAVCCKELDIGNIVAACPNQGHACHQNGLLICSACGGSGLVGLWIRFRRDRSEGK